MASQEHKQLFLSRIAKATTELKDANFGVLIADKGNGVELSSFGLSPDELLTLFIQASKQIISNQIDGLTPEQVNELLEKMGDLK